jgi:hypothetical protein
VIHSGRWLIHTSIPFPLLFFGVLFFFTAALCFSGSKKEKVKEVPLQLPVPSPLVESTPVAAPSRPSGGGVADEIRSLTESGVPSSLLRALDLIRSRDLGSTEFGRIMNAVNAALIQRLYPDMRAQLPGLDPPQTHVYTRLLRETERGNYTPPASGSTDYLEYVLPFLTFFPPLKQKTAVKKKTPQKSIRRNERPA